MVVRETNPVVAMFTRPRSQDVALTAVSVVFALVSLRFDLGEGGSEPNPATYLLAVIGGLSLLARRSKPVPVLAVVVITRLLVTLASGNEVALTLPAMIALYTVASTGQRRRHLAIGLAAALIMMLAVAGLDQDAYIPEFLGEGAQLLLPIAIGDAVRSRADRLRDLIDTEANSRVQAERLRIARDLHDVVAHGLSTIAIQSGVASHLLDRQPAQAKEALDIINRTGKQSLAELRTMVGVLRSTDEPPLGPAPANPDDIGALLTGAADSGLTVRAGGQGSFPADVGDSCVLAVHRIIQEALTNVARHAGPVPVDLTIDHHREHVALSVINQPGEAAADEVPSTGVGIVGMAERAEALGGTLRAAETIDGRFEVAAVIPYNRTTA